MRDYGKVSPQFWIGKTGKELKKAGFEAQIVSLYLLTSPHSNMIGLYYMPLMYMAHETGLGIEGASKGLASAIQCGFCLYDEDSEMVWVPEMASHQIGTSLKPTDKRCAGVQNTYDSQPDNPFLPMFYDRYVTDFNLTNRRDFTPESTWDIEGASKGLASQEQEQEQEKEQDQNTLSDSDRTAGEISNESQNIPASTTGSENQLDVENSEQPDSGVQEKNDPVEVAFEEIFWQAGLRKEAKVKALSAFKTKYRAHRAKTQDSPALFAQRLADDIRLCLQAKKLGFDKILPTSYLNGERWNDEKPSQASATSGGSFVTEGDGEVFVDYSAMKSTAGSARGW